MKDYWDGWVKGIELRKVIDQDDNLSSSSPKQSRNSSPAPNIRTRGRRANSSAKPSKKKLKVIEEGNRSDRSSSEFTGLKRVRIQEPIEEISEEASDDSFRSNQ